MTTLKEQYVKLKVKKDYLDYWNNEVSLLQKHNFTLSSGSKSSHTRQYLTPARRNQKVTLDRYEAAERKLPKVYDLTELFECLLDEANSVLKTYHRKSAKILKRLTDYREKFYMLDGVDRLIDLADAELAAYAWNRYHDFVCGVPIGHGYSPTSNLVGMMVLALIGTDDIFNHRSLVQAVRSSVGRNNKGELYEAVYQVNEYEKPRVGVTIVDIKAWLCYHGYEDVLISDDLLIQKYVVPMFDIDGENKTAKQAYWVSRIGTL